MLLNFIGPWLAILCHKVHHNIKAIEEMKLTQTGSSGLSCDYALDSIVENISEESV